MHKRGTFAADLILASPRAYAAGAVERHGNARQGLMESYADYGFADLISDTTVRLEYLCAALAAGSVELFLDHVGWLKATFAAQRAPEEFLADGLRYLAEELQERLPAEAGKMAGEYLDRGIEHLKTAPGEIPTLLEGEAPHLDLTRRYLLAVLENRADDAVRLIIDAMEGGVSADEIFSDVLERAQKEIGRMWQVGEITVAEEHYGSRIAERVIVELSARTPRSESRNQTVICASVGGNLHDLGIRIVSASFERDGWNSILLGANMPMADSIRAITDFETDLLALSANLALHVRSTADLIRNLRSVAPGSNVPILVGGMPFDLVPDLWKVVGADAVAHCARRAVEEGARLVAGL